MSEQAPEMPEKPAEPISSIELTIQNLQNRIEILEAPENKSIIKRLSENASIAALLLGLALTIAQVRETFFSKPEANRIAQLGALNQSIGAIARLRQEYAEVDGTVIDKKQKLILEGILTTRIANERTTALALLQGVGDNDVGIPQFIVLYNEAMSNGDLESADKLTSRAVSKKDVTDFEHSEALRQRAQFLFTSGQPDEGRIAFEQSMQALRKAPTTAAARSFNLMYLILSELYTGDCERVADEVRRLRALLAEPLVTPEQRGSMIDTLRPQYEFVGSTRCANLPSLGIFP